MRPLALVPVVVLAGVALLAASTGCQQLAQALGTETPDAAATSTTDAAIATDAGVIGGGCGAESNTGITLCTATTLCPNVVVDTSTMPNCGFRIRGSVVDLVCGCNTSICPMGTFASCDEAAAMLAKQTEEEVCTQLANNGCTEVTTPATTSSSTSTSSSSGSTGCDHDCMVSCGGGAACATVCNCN